MPGNPHTARQLAPAKFSLLVETGKGTNFHDLFRVPMRQVWQVQ